MPPLIKALTDIVQWVLLSEELVIKSFRREHKLGLSHDLKICLLRDVEVIVFALGPEREVPACLLCPGKPRPGPECQRGSGVAASTSCGQRLQHV